MRRPFPYDNGTPRAADGESLAVGDLNALLADPSRIARAPVQQLPALLTEVASVQSRLAAVEGAVAARLLAAGAPQAQPDRLLTIDEAAEQLGVTKDWLRRRSTLPFVVKLSDGVVRFSAAGIARFIAQHQGR
jgi:predicted DNA-binding transcriptional regulator AlpA